MDEIKDAQKTGQLSAVLDKQALRTNPFGANRAGERAYRRGERLVAALYLLTNHIAEPQPLKETIRAEGNGLLADSLSLRDHMRAAQSRAIVDFQSRVRYIISLLRMLAVAGNISSGNAGVLIEAFDELGNFISTSQRSDLAEQVVLAREDLADIAIGQKDVKRDTRPIDTIKDIQSLSNKRDVSDKSTPMPSNAVRVNHILEILRTGGSLGIKDIASNLPEYSEKMIQRELLSMTQRGVIRKSGLKRWSKYSLA